MCTNLCIDSIHLATLPKLLKLPITVEMPSRLKVTRTRHATTRDIHIVNRDITAASITTQDVVIPAFIRSSPSHVADRDVLDHDAVRRIPSRAAVEIILLDVDAVDGDILHTDIFEQDVGYETSGIGIRLDAHSVLGVENDGVGEGYVSHVVVCDAR